VRKYTAIVFLLVAPGCLTPAARREPEPSGVKLEKEFYILDERLDYYRLDYQMEACQLRGEICLLKTTSVMERQRCLKNRDTCVVSVKEEWDSVRAAKSVRWPATPQ